MSGKTYAQKQQFIRGAMLDRGTEAGFQKAGDLYMVALATKFGWGETKIKRIYDAVCELDKQYGMAWHAEDESDWAQKEIDAVLKRVCGDAFVPFQERNKWVKQFDYGKNLRKTKQR